MSPKPPFPRDYFERTYDRPDPRAYLRALAPLGYRQPAVVSGYLRRHAGAIAALRRKRRLRVLDFGCGYGMVGGLLKHELTLGELYDLADTEPAADEAFFAARRRTASTVEVGGLDIAGNAVAYGERCGLLDRGFAEDLMQGPPSPELAAFMESVDLIFETGAVYAVLLACLERLLDSVEGEGPWLLLGPRGDADTRNLWQALQARGYRIETCTGAPQRYRRFLHDGEREEAERLIRSRGEDPDARIRDGWYVNPLVLARPRAQADALPIERLAY